MTESLTADLVELLGQETFLKLVEAFPGLRLYVPDRKRDPAIDEAIGLAASEKLHGFYHGSYIRVPLAREMRARAYRAGGLDNQAIARRLGITESGVDRLFARVGHPRRPRRADTRQSDLFG